MIMLVVMMKGTKEPAASCAIGNSPNSVMPVWMPRAGDRFVLSTWTRESDADYAGTEERAEHVVTRTWFEMFRNKRNNADYCEFRYVVEIEESRAEA